MSNDDWSYPPGEPVIGASPPPPPRPNAPAPFGEPETGAPDGWDGEYDGYAEGYDGYQDGDGYDGDAEYGYDDPYGYGEDVPASRQPMFYVFLGLAALVGVAAIFLLMTVARQDDDTAGDSTPAPKAAFSVAIDAPRTGDRFDVGKPVEVAVRATSNEDVARFELFVNDRMVDQVQATAPGADSVYSARLRTQFDRRGEYSLYVRVSSGLGASKDSDKVRVTAVESVDNKPLEIKGKVLTSTTMRTGPGDNFEGAGTLAPPAEVTIIGRNEDSTWVLVDVEGGRWVKAVAVEAPDLALAPIRDGSPSPTPQVTATIQATATPTREPSVTPTPASSPDIVPTNAVLAGGGGRLRVTVQNIGAAPYSGPLVVAISGAPGDESQAFNVDLPANNGRAEVEFQLGTPITDQGKSVRVTVNPDRSPRESNFDNNSANFVLAVSVEPPNLGVTASLTASAVNVTISNSGGPLAAQGARVRVVLGEDTIERVIDLAITKGATSNVSLARPTGSGQARVEVVISGQVVASTTLQVP